MSPQLLHIPERNKITQYNKRLRERERERCNDDDDKYIKTAIF